MYSAGYMCDMFTRTDNTALVFHVAATVKSERYMCSQGRVLQKNCWANVALIELTFLQHLADIGDNWLLVQPPSTCYITALRMSTYKCELNSQVWPQLKGIVDKMSLSCMKYECPITS